jgi:hypothetical protein
MVKEKYFKVQNEFVDDVADLSGVAIKLYLLLRRSVNEQRDDGNKVWWDYEGIHNNTGLCNDSIKAATIELVKKGWIADIVYRFDASNLYYLVDEKIDNPDPEVIEKVSKKKHSQSSKKQSTVLQKIEYSSLENREPVLQKVETNNTNINNTKLNNTKLTIMEEENLLKNSQEENQEIVIDETNNLVGSTELAKARSYVEPPAGSSPPCQNNIFYSTIPSPISWVKQAI